MRGEITLLPSPSLSIKNMKLPQRGACQMYHFLWLLEVGVAVAGLGGDRCLLASQRQGHSSL